jgi:hypothetical protein
MILMHEIRLVEKEWNKKRQERLFVQQEEYISCLIV